MDLKRLLKYRPKHTIDQNVLINFKTLSATEGDANGERRESDRSRKKQQKNSYGVAFYGNNIKTRTVDPIRARGRGAI